MARCPQALWSCFELPFSRPKRAHRGARRNFGALRSFIFKLALDTGATGTLVNADRLSYLGYDLSLFPVVPMTTMSGIEQVPDVTVSRSRRWDWRASIFPFSPITCRPMPPLTAYWALTFCAAMSSTLTSVWEGFRSPDSHRATMNAQTFLERYENSEFRHRELLTKALRAQRCTLGSVTEEQWSRLPCWHYRGIYQERADNLQRFSSAYARRLRTDCLALCEELAKTPDEGVQLWLFEMPPQFRFWVFTGLASERILGCLLLLDNRIIDDEMNAILWRETPR